MPTYYAQVSYTGNGSTTTYAITFNFLDSTHVKAFIDGVETTAFTISSSNLTFTTAPANNSAIKIERQTPIDGRLVDFTDGSVLTESDLDKSADQNFYVAQEITDDSNSKLGLDNSDRYDANNKRIINLANPTDNQDAVTKYYLENTWLSTSDKANITTLAGITDLASLASNNTNVNTCATNIASINTVATDINKVITVANDLNEAVAEIDTVATNINNINTVGNDIANINTLANNIGTVNDFHNRYRVQSSDPSTSLDAGDLVFNTSSNELKYYSGSQWNTVASQDQNVKVTGSDTGTGVLNDKLAVSGSLNKTVTNAGANETLTLSVNVAEFYGFNLVDVDGDGIEETLRLTTTNNGADSITASEYEAFDDKIFAPSGYTWSLNSSGNLIATF